MKRAVFLHGTDGKPTDHWFPWLRDELDRRGYAIYAPVLPNSHTPNHKVYEDFLKKSGWNFDNNLIVGHSSGATTALNLLSADWFPRVRTVVLVGAFLNEKLTKRADWYEEGQFNDLFLDAYDPEVIKRKADNFVFVHGSDDPYCDIDDARALCNELSGEFLAIEGGKHLSSGSGGFTELPGLLEKLKDLL